MSEPDDAPTLTRAQRRTQSGRQGPRGPMPALPAPAHERRPYAVLATVAVSLLVALGGYGGMTVVAAVTLFAGVVLAWGWPGLTSMPSPRGSTAVLAVTALATAVTAAADRELPYLTWLPAGIGLGVLALFLHQLLRFDGRPRLTETLMTGGLGLAVISSGACFIALPLAFEGDAMLATAAAAVAVSGLVDLLNPRAALQPWLLPLAMLAGGVVALGASQVTGHPGPQQSLLLGLLAAGVSHAMRRMTLVLPSMSGARSQLAAGSASVLVCGVVVYVTPSLIAVVAYLWGRVNG